ncbi:hypothetical protein Lal_00002794 [Lupinus albus]|nr:hypothetical protein Lal_00002794 [Lupinus albus]
MDSGFLHWIWMNRSLSSSRTEEFVSHREGICGVMFVRETCEAYWYTRKNDDRTMRKYAPIMPLNSCSYLDLDSGSNWKEHPTAKYGRLVVRVHLDLLSFMFKLICATECFLIAVKCEKTAPNLYEGRDSSKR